MPPRKAARAASTKMAEAVATEKPVVNGIGTGKGRTKGTKANTTTDGSAAPTKAVGRERQKKDVAPSSTEEPKAAPKRKKIDESDTEAKPKAKKAKASETTSTEPQVPQPKGPLRRGGKKTVVNEIRYKQSLKVFVFGEGSSGELGLGASSKAIDVKRPRYNELLSNHNVVRVATGGMHAVALTQDNKILTWGVNDNGALGRDTSDENVKMVDIDEAGSDSDDDSESGLNEKEATPTAISEEHFPQDTQFVDIAAGDSCSFFLTTEGAVYGCGTFRRNEGVLGFARGVETARTPIWISSLKKITQIACGNNHVLALDVDGHVWAWGSGQQNQLGRRVTERSLIENLVPTRLGFRDPTFRRPNTRMTAISCGDYHAFSIAKDGHIWSWGANNYGETGHPENAGQDNAAISTPTIVHALEDRKVALIASGSHHNVASTEDGECLVWGRCDGSQTGIAMKELSAIDDEKVVMKTETTNQPKILVRPTAIPDLKNVTFVAAGTEHCIAIDKHGKAYSWGFSINYQTGQGTTDDVETPTLIDNTAVKETKLIWAGAGSQYSIIASEK